MMMTSGSVVYVSIFIFFMHLSCTFVGGDHPSLALWVARTSHVVAQLVALAFVPFLHGCSTCFCFCMPTWHCHVSTVAYIATFMFLVVPAPALAHWLRTRTQDHWVKVPSIRRSCCFPLTPMKVPWMPLLSPAVVVSMLRMTLSQMLVCFCRTSLY